MSMDLIMTASMPTYKNANLATATDKVFKLGNAIRKNLYEVAHIIADVDASECYKDDSFNNVHEWTMKTFGFKKSASYTLLKVGKEFTRSIESKPDKNGNTRIVGYESNLLPENSGKDFTTTQIECMLPIGEHSDIVNAVETGTITPDMSCKAIKAVVKEMKKGDKPEPEITDEKGSSETETVENPDESEPKYFKSIHLVEYPDGSKTFEINGETIPVTDYSKVLEMISTWAVK